jgi:hypothetical protein
MRKVSGVILANFRRDVQVRAKKCGSEFSDQLLACITRIAKALAAEIAL